MGGRKGDGRMFGLMLFLLLGGGGGVGRGWRGCGFGLMGNWCRCVWIWIGEFGEVEK